MCKQCQLGIKYTTFKLNSGDTFKSKWFDGLVKVLKVNEQENTLSVQINPQKPGQGIWTESDWILSHTISGLQQGEYYNYHSSN